MSEQTTAISITKRRYEPLSPIGSTAGLKELLQANAQSISIALPKHCTPERLIKTMLVAANKTPDLLLCTQSSILETINRAAELGLDLSGTLGECYPVPFNNKVKVDGREIWVKQCQLIIGYRGMEKLAWQTGEISSIDAEVVHEGDTFTFKKGSTVLVEWSPCLNGEAGRPIGAYCCIKLKDGGQLARFMPVTDVEKIRAGSKSKDSPTWQNHWNEMARKCVIKRTLKDAPLSTEKFSRAMEIDAEDMETAEVQEAETVQSPLRQKLLENRKITTPNVAEPSVQPSTVQTSAEETRTTAEAATQSDSEIESQAEGATEAEKAAETPEDNRPLGEGMYTGPVDPSVFPQGPKDEAKPSVQQSSLDDFIVMCENLADEVCKSRGYVPDELALKLDAALKRCFAAKRYIDSGGDTEENRAKILSAIEECRSGFAFLLPPEKEKPQDKQPEVAEPPVANFQTFRSAVEALAQIAKVDKSALVKTLNRVALACDCMGTREKNAEAQDDKGKLIREKLARTLEKIRSGAWDWINPPTTL